MAVRLIAFDLDYTLLDSQKRVSAENLEALRAAAEKGIYTVPATGRIFNGLPEEIKALPELRWCIFGNGARIFDAKEHKTVISHEIAIPDAFEVFDYADSLGLRYDCYAGDCGWMERKDYEMIDSFIIGEPAQRVIRSLRKPVDGLRSFITENFETILKIQIYFTDPAQRLEMLEVLPERFPGLSVSSSLPFNIEVNSGAANKGRGLTELCGIIGIEPEECMAFGDGMNDFEMLQTAGKGVAMANADERLKKIADFITGSCDESGVAQAIKRFAL